MPSVAKIGPIASAQPSSRLLRVEGRTLLVAGLDAIDGTPVLDIKPVMREFLPPGEVHQPEWVGELMIDYWSKPA